MKMPLFFLILLIGLCKSHGQTIRLKGFTPQISSERIIRGKSMVTYIDSLKSKIYLDTLKFDIQNLVLSDHHVTTKKPYSAIYYSGLFHYRLDVVNGKLVTEFVEEFLNPKKIRKIVVLNFENEAYPSIFIITKQSAKVNYEIAGFKLGQGISSNY